MSSEKDKFDELTQNQFKKWSPFYDSKPVRLFYFERIYQKILYTIRAMAHIYPLPGSRFLDVACGTGEMILRLAQEFPSVEFVGTDFSEDMLAIARQKTAHLKNVKIIIANVRSLPFPDKIFDTILCSDAFHHFSSPEESLKEIARVVKDNGFLFLVDPAYDTLLQKVVLSIFGSIFETAKKYYSEKELSTLLKDAGFRVNHFFNYYFTNFFIYKK